ncbi:MAG: Beta-galactosidase C-terminal domain [Oscillospiraceae bacterium]|nr:Beta-galactosidase C-terminal domain [Oscillospiraceae bacterium]MBQ6426072.1 Beta-galactosidase C-terminal domain [Clostridia bacterium]
MTCADLKSVLLKAAEAAGIPEQAIRFPVVCKRRGRLLFLLNFSDGIQRVPAPAAGRELLSERFVEKEEELFLSPWNSAIIEIE